MPDEWEGDLSKYPRWDGAEIFINIGEERPTRGKYFSIQQAGNSSSEVFEALIADVCDAILNNSSNQNTENVIMNRLEKWKSFFHEQKQGGLSSEEQQGLFAELLFMYQVLFPALGRLKALKSWTGPKRMSRDFELGGHAFEVKSSSSKLHQKIKIANERQLDVHGLLHLDLIFISLETMEGGEQSLPQLVQTITDSIKDDPSTSQEFSDKLFDAGYLKVHETNYQKTFIVRSLVAYRVSEGFPRILENDLLPGVGDVSYSIMLAACEGFEIPMSLVISDLQGLLTKGR
jgi:hypothetical protein